MRPRIVLAAMLAIWPFAVSGGFDSTNEVELVKDDFARFPPGLLSAPIGQLNGAIQEYHYLEHRGVRTHPWRNPIVHLDSWASCSLTMGIPTSYPRCGP